MASQGNYQGALVSFQQSKSGGQEGPVLEAYILFCKYCLDNGSAMSVRRHIEKENSEDLRSYQQSLLWMLMGHLDRMDDEFDAALKSYAKAVKLDRGNDEAARWVQRIPKLKEKKANSGFLNKLLNTKITLGGKK